MSLPPPLFVVRARLLAGGGVGLDPSLDEVQRAVNRCATAVLAATRGINTWAPLSGTLEGDCDAFFNEIARNKDITKMVLLLTGSIHGLRQQVEDHLSGFSRFEVLWRSGTKDAYEEFRQKSPTTDDFASELQRYSDISAAIDEVPDTHTVASLLIDATPLKTALREETKRWKHRFAELLHVVAKAELERLVGSFDLLERRLKVKVLETVTDLADLMNALTELRGRAAAIDTELKAVELRYLLLAEHGHEVPPEQEHDVGDLRYRWKKLHLQEQQQETHIARVWRFFQQDLSSGIQRFGVEVITFRNAYEEFEGLLVGSKPRDVLDRLRKFQRSFEEKLVRAQQYSSGALLFGIKAPHHPELQATQEGLDLLTGLYALYYDIEQKLEHFSQLPWSGFTADFDAVVRQIRGFEHDCAALPADMKATVAFEEITLLLDDFIQHIPLLRTLAHPNMRDRHWRRLMQVCRRSWGTSMDGFRPGRTAELLEAGLLQCRDDIDDIALQAAKEAHIEEGLKRVTKEWSNRDLVFAPHPKGRGEIMLKAEETFDTRDALEESQLQLSALIASRHVAEFREEANQCLAKLSAASENLSIWMEVQASWMHLEAVFAGSDIARQLPQEAKQFQVIDRQWCKIMSKAQCDPNVLRFCHGGEILGGLPALQEQLQECQRKLSVYLEQKRTTFPRFNFVSESILLEILAQASDPSELTAHLPKIFSGIESLEMQAPPHSDAVPISPRSENSAAEPVRATTCAAIRSPEDEVLQLVIPVQCESDVEVWLETLCQEVAESVRHQLRAAYADVLAMQQSGTLDIQQLGVDRPAQVTIVALRLLWTMDATSVLSAPRIEQRRAALDLRRRWSDATASLIDDSRARGGAVNRRQRTALESQIVTAMHLNDVWSQLSAREPARLREPLHAQWDWQRQVRYYWRPDIDSCSVRIADSELCYALEYQGVTESLVVTQLTDRCYLTLSQALSMHAGGAPIGPAGTGKTETVKELSRMCARLIVVFNCSEAMDFRATGRIIKGLAQAGAWGSFDEFNRLELPVLSVVAAQVSCVLAALKQRRPTFAFTDSSVIRVGHTSGVPTVGLFITMNPDYAGRRELPQNLRSLFRFVGMMVPERREIIKTKLAAAGYRENDSLARRFDMLYKLSESQLSQQRHYDFSLRNVLSVLRLAGPALRTKYASDSAQPSLHRQTTRRHSIAQGLMGAASFSMAMSRRRSHSPLTGAASLEEDVLVQVLRDLNLPKLEYSDVAPFESLLVDLFGKRRCPPRHQSIRRALEVRVDDEGLDPVESWVEKAMQLYEVKLARHGLMLLGTALTGKTAMTRVLRDALSEHDRERNRELRLNPKSISVQQFYGFLDPGSGEWHNGIFSHLFRKVNSKESAGRSRWWLVCDGPVDPTWVESINSVLDDNRLLTLANNDRILMAHTTLLLFEVENLLNANPSTVSRMGMVSVSEADLPWLPIVKYQLLRAQGDDQVNSTLRNFVFELYRKHGAALWNAVSDAQEQSVATSSLRMSLTGSCPALAGLLAALGGSRLQASSVTVVERAFWLAVGWTCAAQGSRRAHDIVDAYVRGHASKGAQPPEAHKLLCCTLRQDGRWMHWTIPAQPLAELKAKDVPSMFQHTVHTLAVSAIARSTIQAGAPVLIVGAVGTGKTSTGAKLLTEATQAATNAKRLRWRRLAMWHSQTPEQMQTWLGDQLEKQGARKHGPRGGGRLCFFLDDVGLPALDQWGDSPVCELLRQVVEWNGLWSLERVGEYKALADVMWAASITAQGLPHCSIPARLLRHFTCIHLLPPTPEELQTMFSPALVSFFATDRGFEEEIKDLALQLLSCTVMLWQSCAAELPTAPGRIQPPWQVRDLTRIVQGLMLARPEQIDEEELLLLWQHECDRVLVDRLVSEADRAWVIQQKVGITGRVLGKLAAQALEASTNELFVPAFQEPRTTREDGNAALSHASRTSSETPGSGEEPSFRRTASINVGNSYNRVSGPEAVREALERWQRLQAESQGGDQLVLFDDAIRHVLKITRVLTMPQGSIMLVGEGGRGRSSLAQLAAYVVGLPCSRLSPVREYTDHEFLDLVRDQARRAVSSGAALLFRDAEIRGRETFLEVISQLLRGGEVPGLFAQEDRDDLRTDLISIAQRDVPNQFQDTDDWLWGYFSQLLRNNLHLILCISPSPSDRFSRWMHCFPALTAECCVSIVPTWPDEALLAVAADRLDQVEFATIHLQGSEFEVASAAVREGLLKAAAMVPSAVRTIQLEFEQRHRRTVQFTPRNYLQFLKVLKSLFRGRIAETGRYAVKVQTGLQRLRDAEKDVQSIKIQVKEKENKLADAMEAQEALRYEFHHSSAEAERKRAEASRERNRLAEEAETVSRAKKSAESDLLAAQPALAAAKAALDAITPQDVKLVKGLISPPVIVRYILDAVSIVMKEPVQDVRVDADGKGRLWLADSWYSTGRQLVQRIDFIALLEEFNGVKKDWMNEETLELLEPYLLMDDFNEDRARKACGNVAGLCSWVRAMFDYYWVAKDVEPKKRLVREAEASWRMANKKLDEAQVALDKVEAEVRDSARKLVEQEKRQKELQDESWQLTRTTDAANVLIDALSGEKDRWTSQSRSFRDTLAELPGECLVAAAFVVFAGPFTPEVRKRLFTSLVVACTSNGVPLGNMHDVKELLKSTIVRESSAETVGDWQRQGLPGDAHSIQNAIILTTTIDFEFPYLIDPQGQGTDWLRRRLAGRGGQETRLTDPNFLGVLAAQMQTGNPLVIDNVGDDVPPALIPLLSRSVHRGGRAPQVMLFDRLHDIADGFQLYLCARAATRRITPELEALVNVVDFTVTQDGLEQQLLQRVLESERADLEQERAILDSIVNEKKKHLRTLEDQLLQQISQKETSLVEDDHLMHTLADIKNAQNEIHDQLASAQEARRRIILAREEYRPAAVRGAVLYQVILELAKVAAVYHTSLGHFLVLFDKGVSSAPHFDLPARRMEAIIDQVTRCVFHFVMRGLLEDHKQLFSLLLACKIGLRAGTIKPDAFSVLLRGGAGLLPDQVPDQPAGAQWLPQRAWEHAVAVSRTVLSLRLLPGLCENYSAAWRMWYDDDAPETAPLPSTLRDCTAFEKMLVVRCLREDRTLLAARLFVSKALSPSYADSPPSDLDAVCQEAGPFTPILFLLSAGSDPPAAVGALGKKRKKNVMSVSIGQGQEAQAWVVVHDALNNGGWALLQNAHFGLSFVQKLGEHLERLKSSPDAELVSPDARIWITSEPNPDFPPTLLDKSIKIADAPPQGIRAGVRRLWSELPYDTLLAFRRVEYRLLLYGFCFLHCLLQGRCRFGSLGWAKPYDFDTSDFTAAITFLQSHFASIGDDPRKGQAVGYDSLRHMLSGIYYGGRVTDEGDRRVLRAQVSDLLCRLRSPHGMLAPGCCLAPRESDAVELQSCLDSIPQLDTPALFGLHPNAGLACRVSQSCMVLTWIREAQPRDIGEDAEGRTQVQRALAAAQGLVQKVPRHRWQKEVLTAQLAAQTADQPLTVFLSQEIAHLTRVLDTVTGDLRQAINAFQGDFVSFSGFLVFCDCLCDGAMPPRWSHLGGPQRGNVGSWVADLSRRHAQLDAWLCQGRPRDYWIGGFNNPRGFLCAVTQEIVRAHQAEGWGLDRAVVKAEVTRLESSDVEKPPPEGVYVTGVLLEGASWQADRQIGGAPHAVGCGRLREQTPREDHVPLPVLLVSAEDVDPRRQEPTQGESGWLVRTEKRPKGTRQVYHCPCFQNPRRGDHNLVCSIRMPCEEDTVHWTLRGCAAVCAAD